MVQLGLGLALFGGTHLFRRLAPARRRAMGDAAKGAVAVLSVLGVALMARGYGAWDDRAPLWVGPGWLRPINNLLMVGAFYLLVASGMRTRVTRPVRHPQLAAVTVWAVAHLLVNGDAPSVLLFGGLGAWAVAEMAVINRAEPRPAPPPPAPWGREAAAVGITAVAVAVVGWLHGRIGPWPFG